ncbi:MAG: TIGR03032 family protein [Planctomycetes bacterium]|nr:TIGR03032 family protein [Planctomycetota bacterium]
MNQPESQHSGAASASQPWLNVMGSRYFLDWLQQQRVSLAFTTYQTGKLFFVGRKPDQAISVFERTYNHCMGMWASPDARTIWLSSRFQIWRLESAAATAVPYQPVDPDDEAAAVPPWAERGYDIAYVPRVGYTTGHLDVHDMALDANGRLIFVNTMFGCLATLSETASFQPLWRPPFLSALVPEDRCHLNGLAMVEGRPKYVTAASRSDVADGWRDRRDAGGVAIDVESNEIVAEGLSMPHSPRWYKDTLWLIDSGTGFFGRVDLDKGEFEPLTFLPGFARGLTFSGDYAIVGLSDRRENRTFQDLDLEENLKARDTETRCGLLVIDLDSFDAPHWLRFGGIVKELYDVGVLPGVIRPMAVGFKTDEVRRYLSFPDALP